MRSKSYKGIGIMSDDISALLRKINKVYVSSFGRTPLKQRLLDIQKETFELSRYVDLKSMKEEAGDLLTTLLQLFNECEWDINEVVDQNLAKIRKRRKQYKALGRKSQVAILGGAFDPITLGHIQVAQLILNQSMTFDEVYLMPCYNHIFNKKMVSPEHRLEMCRIAAQVDGRIKVFDYEIANKFSGETYNLAKRLFEDKEYKDTHSFSFVIGLDNANSFDTWVNYEELERLARFVVVPRTGEKPKKGVNWYLKPPHIFLEPDEPLMEMSSTKVRRDLELLWLASTATKLNPEYNNDPTAAFNTGLDKKVKEYILENQIYQ